jgi:hypothetical protein
MDTNTNIPAELLDLKARFDELSLTRASFINRSNPNSLISVESQKYAATVSLQRISFSPAHHRRYR